MRRRFSREVASKRRPTTTRSLTGSPSIVSHACKMDSYNPFHTGSFACFFKAFSAPLHNRMRGCGGSFPISIETLLSAPDHVAKKEITTTSTIPFAFILDDFEF